MRLRLLAILAAAAIVTGGIAGARINRSPSRPTLHLHPHAPATTTTLPVSPEVTAEPTSTTVPPPSLPPPSQPPQPPQPPPAPPSEPATYVVQPGDTLASIGAAHGIDWWALCFNNHVADCNLIYPGQVLKLDGTPPPSPPPSAQQPPPTVPPQSQPTPSAQHPQPPPSSPCAQAVADVNAHGLFLPGNFRIICPGQALYGTAKAGPGIQAGGCPCSQASGVTYFGDGPEGPGPYVSIRHVTPYIIAYEFCNANLAYDSVTGNSHDRQSGGTLNPSTADCVASHGISQ